MATLKWSSVTVVKPDQPPISRPHTVYTPASTRLWLYVWLAQIKLPKPQHALRIVSRQQSIEQLARELFRRPRFPMQCMARHKKSGALLWIDPCVLLAFPPSATATSMGASFRFSSLR